MNAALPPPQAAAPWATAASVAALFAVDPLGTGVVVRSAAGAPRDAWLELLREAVPGDRRWRRVPLHVADHRLLGGLDLTATLRAGRPVAERGLLVEADGTLLVLAMAERVEPSMAARIGAVLDARAVVLERDGITLVTETSFGVIALDEGAAPEERVSLALRDRLAFEVDLRALRAADCPQALVSHESIAAARERLPRVVADDATLTALCRAGLALGVDSLRASCQALRVACAAAALAGRDRVSEDDAALAAALVFGHRATRVPPASEDERAGDEQEADSAEEGPAPETPPETPPEAPREPPPEARGEESAAAGATPPDPPNPAEPTEPESSPAAAALDDEVVAAATAAIPADLLARLANAGELRGAAGAGGRSGGWRASKRRGRPAGVRRGELRAGSRLNVIETLRAAAPWQPLRRRANATPSASPGSLVRPRIEIRQDDFRVTRYRERTQTTTIFAVDASGSAALHRLGEAKGAVELLLADCYVRRDQVALIAFRGRGADLLLPPTRSLLRAKRGLAALPGGGGTPLASGLDAALLLADATRRRGEVALIVLLTDGRGNIARDGRPGRDAAEADALAAARSLRLAGHAALLVDTSPQPRPQAARLAREMNARYLALPYADAARISGAILAATPRPP